MLTWASYKELANRISVGTSDIDKQPTSKQSYRIFSENIFSLTHK